MKNSQIIGLCLFLVAITAAVFGQTVGFDFVNLDDNLYVYENARVMGGLTWQGIAWVFTHAECSLYHPLTMLSLMADYQLYGLAAGGYHLTNLLLHCGSVVILFLVLLEMTGTVWRSLFVATVFAIHPLRAESVAWVGERKDVLSAFFFMLALGAYVQFVRKPSSLARYLTVIVTYALALLSKPSVVTFPFLLLILDYWPLRRTEPVKRLVWEKIPLFALAAAASMANAWAAKNEIAANGSLPIISRIGNALVSYAIYLRQMAWPANLAVPYPMPPHGRAPGEIILAILLLGAVSILAWCWRRNRPWLITGWLWYLGVLAPMLGIVSVGSFAHADRYTYLSQIGICVALAWTLPVEKIFLARIAVVLLMACAWQQTSYWKNNETLWTHTLTVTSGNELAHCDLGAALFAQKRLDEALAQYQLALKINPNAVEPQYSLGNTLLQKGDLTGAIDHFNDALRLDPKYAAAENGLGEAMLRQGHDDAAAGHFRQALRVNPNFNRARVNLSNYQIKHGQAAEAMTSLQQALQVNPRDFQAHYNLANIFLQRGQLDEAIDHYNQAITNQTDYAEAYINRGNALLQKGELETAIASLKTGLQLKPDNIPALVNLGNAYLRAGGMDDAVEMLRKAVELEPGFAEAHAGLGAALRRKGDIGAAIAQYEQTLKIDSNNVEVQNGLAWLLATSVQPQWRNGSEAVKLALAANEHLGGKNPAALRTLAAAQAETGNFNSAAQCARQAIELAQQTGQQALAEQLNSELKLYESSHPFHQ